MPPKKRHNPEAEEGTSRLLEWAEEKKKLLVGVGAIVVLAALGLVFFAIFRKQAEEKRWGDLLTANLLSPMGSTPTYEDIVNNGGSEIQAHALYDLAINQIREKEYDAALESLDKLETQHPESFLNVLPSPDMRISLVGKVRKWIEAERAWDKEHAYEEPEVDTSEVALVETDKGAFWLGFYPELAPKHVEDFIARAKSGDFNGTSVTRITQGLVQFGGEASKDEDPQNDDPETERNLLAPAPSRFRVKPERGAVANLNLDAGESPTRFQIVTGPFGFSIDKKASVFAKVLSDRYPALATIDELKNIETWGTTKDPAAKDNPLAAKLFDHPFETVRIQSISIWKDGAIEEGHDWDTSAVVKPEASEAPEAPEEGTPEPKDD